MCVNDFFLSSVHHNSFQYKCRVWVGIIIVKVDDTETRHKSTYDVSSVHGNFFTVMGLGLNTIQLTIETYSTSP